jgi:hypothetical protein
MEYHVMTNGGDNRFYNNIFMRKPGDDDAPVETNFWDGAPVMDGVPAFVTFTQTPVGTAQYEEYPGPDDAGIEIEITDRAAGEVTIRIAKPELLNTGLCKIVTTETLGRGFHAEMNFEETDGRPYLFETDFFGHKRDQITPGPFETSEPATLVISF